MSEREVYSCLKLFGLHGIQISRVQITGIPITGVRITGVRITGVRITGVLIAEKLLYFEIPTVFCNGISSRGTREAMYV